MVIDDKVEGFQYIFLKGSVEEKKDESEPVMPSGDLGFENAKVKDGQDESENDQGNLILLTIEHSHKPKALKKNDFYHEHFYKIADDKNKRLCLERQFLDNKGTKSKKG